MRETRITIAALLVMLGLSALAVRPASQHEHGGGTPEQLGKVHFPISCNRPAQAEFDRAVAMLHSFWFEESEKTFRKVTELDASCAMGHWGEAMSHWHELWQPPPGAAALAQGRAALRQARAAGAPTPREQDYIAAIGAFYDPPDSQAYRPRSLAYLEAMQHLHQRFPEDSEGAAFYALALLATAEPSDKSYANQKRAGAILQPLFAAQPDHPGLAHYLIHAYDYPPLAEEGLAAARVYARIAPSVPHALHMPSHIFTRLGLWQDSIRSNLASSAAARDYAQREHLGGTWDEQLHAMDYLEYAYLQIAQDDEAMKVRDEIQAVLRTVPESLKAAYPLAAVPARFALERGDWAAAAALAERSNLPAAAESITQFARGVGGARSGNRGVARSAIARLEALHQQLARAGDDYWAGQVEIQRLAAAAWLARAEGRDEQALRLMRDAADRESKTEKDNITPGAVLPARELLGDLLLELKQPAAALAEYQTSLQSAPGRFHAQLGAARAAESAGDSSRARNYYSALLEMCGAAVGQRPELAEARRFLLK